MKITSGVRQELQILWEIFGGPHIADDFDHNLVGVLRLPVFFRPWDAFYSRDAPIF